MKENKKRKGKVVSPTLGGEMEGLPEWRVEEGI
jgi:hypothetical protein